VSDNGAPDLCNEHVISLYNMSNMLSSYHQQLPAANLKYAKIRHTLLPTVNQLTDRSFIRN